jgi:hypothetical protein
VKFKIQTDMNRFKILIGMWVSILAYCVFFSHDVTFNAIAISLGFIGMLIGFVHVERNMTKKELRFFNKYINII